MDDLYDHGFLPKHRLRELWEFNEEAILTAQALGRGDGIETLAETLIKVLMQLDLVFEHSGLLGDGDSGDSSQEWYLVPEVWSERWESPAGQECVGAQALPSTYDCDTHVMIAWEMKVEGWVLASFFRKFVCKCARALTKMDNMWRGGRATLGRDALRWESAAWPGLGKALALWLERSEARVVTVKVAGLKDERYVMRDVSVMVAKILQELAEDERVVIVERRVGTLPPGGSAADALVWIDEKEVEQRLKSGERSVELVHNGRRLDIPLYHFDINASPGDVIPNFDAQQLIPREAHDPEFLIHHLGAGDATAPKPPFASRWVRATVKKVMAGRWEMPMIVRVFYRWKTLLARKQTKKRIQIVDVARYGAEGTMTHVEYQLYVSHPSRSLYVQAENFHATVLTDFCKEVLKLFKVLRAKKATIMVRCCDEEAWRVGGQARAMGQGVGAATERQSNHKFKLSFKRQWKAPPRLPPSSSSSSAEASSDSHALGAESWFFLAESSAPSRTLIHGLDLSIAKSAILSMKEARVGSGAEIGTGTLSLQYSKSDRLELFANAYGFGPAGFENSKRKTLMFEMEYDAQVYEWNEADERWE